MTSAAAGSRKRRLPLRYLLPSILLVVVVVMLLLRGYVHSEFLADHRVRPAAGTTSVPDRVLEGGPVLDARGEKPVSHRVPDRNIVLTFDDGPDPEWTPKILDKLAEHDAHAVFFVTGTMTSRHPDLVRRMVAEGHEVGLHSFNHPDLSYQSASRIDRELAQSQLALAGAAGIRTSLFRPPYSSTVDALDDKSWPVTRQVAEHGYISTFIDTDSKDWARPGVEEIVRRAMPEQPGKGAVVLMHDSGGDRSQTVAALDRLLPRLQAQGYRFPHLTEALGAPSPNTAVQGTGPLEGVRLRHGGRCVRARHERAGGVAGDRGRPGDGTVRADARAVGGACEAHAAPRQAQPVGAARFRTRHRAGLRAGPRLQRA